MIADACFHRRSNAQRLMHASEVVVHVKEGNHRDMVVQLFAERIRQTSEAAIRHSQVKVLPFDVADRNMLLIRVADNFDSLSAQTLRGAVAFLSLRIVAVNLHQLREVNPVAERVGNRRQIHLVAVRGQLDSIRQPASYVLKKVRRTPRIPPTYHPTDNEFRVRVDRGEGPNVPSIANALPHLRRGVLFLGVTERPNLIDLDALRRYVANRHVLVFLASLADLRQRSEYRALGNASHPRRGSDRATLNQCSDYRNLLFSAEYVRHDSIVRQRFRIVNRKC